jgi:hypothetical protein
VKKLKEQMTTMDDEITVQVNEQFGDLTIFNDFGCWSLEFSDIVKILKEVKSKNPKAFTEIIKAVGADDNKGG